MCFGCLDISLDSRETIISRPIHDYFLYKSGEERERVLKTKLFGQPVEDKYGYVSIRYVLS